MSSRLNITPNVKSMLSHLRKAHKPRYLWIDAICLNQGDSIEKAQQIPLMGEIYSQADKVHIWLGPGDGEDTARMFSLFRLVALSPEPVDIENAVSVIFSDRDSASQQINRFFEHPWFFRRWILQEATLSKFGIVLCGASHITYPVFIEACRRLQNSERGQNKYAIETTLALSRGRSTRDIFDLLWLFHKSDCHEKRDRIMALYGFITRQKQLSLDSNTTHVSLYKKHAIWLIENSREHEMFVHLFHFGPLPVQQDTAKPELCSSSWIPDWSNQRLQPLMIGFPIPSSPGFDASKLVSGANLRFQGWQKRQPLTQERICSSWRGFLFEHLGLNDDILMSSTRRIDLGTVVPCTLFTGDQDESGTSVLSVRWINPWAGLYGRPVKRIVTIPDLPNKWMDVVGLFHGFFLDYLGKPPLETNVNRLSLLVEAIMSQKHCHSLRHWEPDDRPLVVQQAMTLMATKTYKEPPLLCKYVNMSESGLPVLETLQNIILDLGTIMHECQMAVVEIGGVQDRKSVV